MTTHLLSRGAMVKGMEVSSQFAVDGATTTGLTFGYATGLHVAQTVRTLVPAGTIALTASSTNWIELLPSGQVTLTVAANPATPNVIYRVTTDGSGITEILDCRGGLIFNVTSFS